MTERFHIPLAPTQAKFVRSNAPIVAIIGPEGEGKTYSGLAAALYHAQFRMGGKPLCGAIIRDTFENVKSKTVDSITKAVAKIAEVNSDRAYMRSWHWHDGYKILLGPHGIKFDLFGANDPGDRTRLQGSDKWSFIWIEEPAPMFAHNNSGIPHYIFDDAVSRAARGGGAMRLQITMNPADMDHWTFDRLKKRPIMHPPETPSIFTEVFHIPYGENPARTNLQREATRAAYRNDPALTARLVHGEFCDAFVGEAVIPEYQPRTHRAQESLPIIARARGVRFYDGGLCPTCIVGQITPSGRLFLKKTFRGKNIGMKQLLTSEVVPYLAHEFKGVKSWLDVGDPSLKNREQSDSDNCAAKTIEEILAPYGCTEFIPGLSPWEPRRETLKAAMNEMRDGLPWLQIDPEDHILHKSMAGGWHYLVDSSGKAMKDLPVKDEHSHAGDALSYGVTELLGVRMYDPNEQGVEDDLVLTPFSRTMGI
jgi:hypothetical protein